MHDVERALAEIAAVRVQIARRTEFRGYGPATLALTAGFALLGAGVQALWLPQPQAAPFVWLALWGAVAMVSIGAIGSETVRRSRRLHTGLAQEMLLEAFEQFAPAGVAGALLGFVIARFVPETLWMLPGLWQIAVSLGIFASCRFLPRPIYLVAGWYMLCGLFCLALSGGAVPALAPLSPLAMGLPFAIGQLAVAVILKLHGDDEDAPR